jgi:hypothetical protein
MATGHAMLINVRLYRGQKHVFNDKALNKQIAYSMPLRVWERYCI